YDLPAAGTEHPGDSPRAFRFIPQWQRTIALYMRESTGRITTHWLDDGAVSRQLEIGARLGVPLDESGSRVETILV
ncbi:hypothetical protein, partial [Pseudomonas aeruginosa]|uniref:hypothetical protein n=1 Tax=Pseudomonas aeruginosa TaxID=287 RepID=UPI00397A5448